MDLVKAREIIICDRRKPIEKRLTLKSEKSDFVRAENRHCDISSEAKALLPHSLPVSCSEGKKKLEGNEKPRKGKRKKKGKSPGMKQK